MPLAVRRFLYRAVVRPLSGSASASRHLHHPEPARARYLAPLAALCIALTACSTPTPMSSVAPVDPVGLFPMSAYDQNVDHWLDPADPNYDQPFLGDADQHAHFAALRARYFGTSAKDPSPWNPAYVVTRVYSHAGADIAALQRRRIAWFDNTGKAPHDIGYGQNFRPHTQAWIDAIARNMDVGQFERDARYLPARRAISTDNVLVRELPTFDPSFYSHRLAGEGYPFDNLQISALRPGTPLYVLGSSLDGGWRYVQTPEVQGWVRSDEIAAVDEAFVTQWRDAANHGLAAVIVASASIRDTRGTFRFDAPAGTLLPLASASANAARESATSQNARTVLIPARDIDGNAVIRRAQPDASQLATLPWRATPHHLAMLMTGLIGRPYGWGNTGFYNDCSSELQSIFAAFGVWLPRHSSTQMSAGQMTDLSASSVGQRLDWLVEHGKPMRSLIYIGGHVMLYIGTTTRDGRTVPVVYQDVWGMRPADNSRRAIIGGSVILPLLAQMPEDPALESLAGTRIFQVSILGAPDGTTPVPPDDDNPAG
ncbi:SH3 domain-containing C40 family peptidase [Paraburkholderia sp.]|uniref:SH3 domain-containing C40 family peptidase n=1 Tax=Paraburkholderia sp. TaxID=1926495 RepID=UPI00238EEF25|nr:SH3 domain-containing C40 family peptidase [Paraburkholderia sp.]MDE1180126.1 NlpC/P60 family N-terminal domain-containing protein [Paraburkholderia sp.]